MGEGFRRKQAKAFKHRESAAFTARFATADLLSNTKNLVEVVEAVCDLTDPSVAPAVGSEVIVQARSLSSADVMVCNRRIATLNIESADLQRLFGPNNKMVVGVVTEHGEFTPCITIAIQEPPEGQ